MFGILRIRDLATLWMMGFGAVNLQTLITGDNWPTSLIVNTLIANAAQPTFSVLYFAYNGLFTCMTLRTEWSQYAVSRKGLRSRILPRAPNAAPISCRYHTATQFPFWQSPLPCIGSSPRASSSSVLRHMIPSISESHQRISSRAGILPWQ